MKRAQPKTTKKNGFAESRNAVRFKKKQRPEDASPKDPLASLKKVERAKAQLLELLDDEADEDDDDSESARPAKLVGATLTDKELARGSSRFMSEIDLIRDQVTNTNGDFNADAGARALLRATLSATLELVGVAENVYRKEKREQQGYVFVALSTQARDLFNDLRMMNDVENQSQFIGHSILHPIFIAVTQTMLQELMELKNQAANYCTDRRSANKLSERLNATMRTMGQFMTEAEAKTTRNIHSYLSGDMSFVEGANATEAPKKRKRRSK